MSAQPLSLDAILTSRLTQDDGKSDPRVLAALPCKHATCTPDEEHERIAAMKLLSRWFRRSPTAPSWIEPAALATRLEQDASLLVLDVRGPDEFTGPLGHIREAKNIPLNELPSHLPDLARDDRPVIVVCKTDRRSSMAAQQLRQAGMAKVAVLRGGMERWREIGLPIS